MPKEDQLVKLLLVGASKAGKTHYCMEAAEKGFNVLYLDGDVSRPTIMSFSTETLDRVWYMNLGDTRKVARQWLLMKSLFGKAEFLWDDTNQKEFTGAEAEEVGIWSVILQSMTYRDVLVIDSWTSLVHSMKKYIAGKQGLDLTNMQDADLRSLYGAGNYMSDFLLSCIQTLTCHVIVTAHPAEYEHKVKPKGLISGLREKDMILKSVRSIPLSFSNPHGNKMGKHFTDVAWIAPDITGRHRVIDGRPDVNRESGGRFNGVKKTAEFSFLNLVHLAQGIVPGDPEWNYAELEGIKEHAKGEWKPPEVKGVAKGVLKSRGGKILLTR